MVHLLPPKSRAETPEGYPGDNDNENYPPGPRDRWKWLLVACRSNVLVRHDRIMPVLAVTNGPLDMMISLVSVIMRHSLGGG
jgi:hypothetical protein